jgi:hypothetical protein
MGSFFSCIIIMDTSIQFDDIRQKYKGNSGENKQNRGMASLDDRVQEVMLARLKHYGFVDSKHHLPSTVPSGVVLNSGGSFLQLWHVHDGHRTVIDEAQGRKKHDNSGG